MSWDLDEELTALEGLAGTPVLDGDERLRLRDLLGPPSTPNAIDLRDNSDHEPPPPTVEDRIANLSFVLGDIDRKIEKLSDTGLLIEQLGDQVRRLSERIQRIEQILIGRTKTTRF